MGLSKKKKKSTIAFSESNDFSLVSIIQYFHQGTLSVCTEGCGGGHQLFLECWNSGWITYSPLSRSLTISRAVLYRTRLREQRPEGAAIGASPSVTWGTERNQSSQGHSERVQRWQRSRSCFSHRVQNQRDRWETSFHVRAAMTLLLSYIEKQFWKEGYRCIFIGKVWLFFLALFETNRMCSGMMNMLGGHAWKNLDC